MIRGIYGFILAVAVVLSLNCSLQVKTRKAAETLWGIEAKKPFLPAEELKLRELSDRVLVSGETFQYTFSRSNGLLEKVEVLGTDLTGDLDTAYPDNYISAAHDPINELYYQRENARRLNNPITRPTYYARFENQARLSVDHAAPDRVVIRGVGLYKTKGGESIGMQYEVTYEVFIDGVTYVRVRNRALNDLTFRYLTLSGGAIKESAGKYFARLGDLALSQSTSDFSFNWIPKEDGAFIEATFLPWFWLGDERVGLEINTWDVRNQRFGHTEDWFRPKPKMNRELRLDNEKSQTYFMWGDPLGDPAKMFLVSRENGAVRWTNFLVRNLKMSVRKGWEQTDCFSLSITPPKAYDPYFATLKGFNRGPYTYSPGWEVPDVSLADTLKARGYDYVIGLVNCRTGEYLPENPEESKNLIRACQERGIEVFPYTTLMDLNVFTDTYAEHGEEWAIDPATDHSYHTFLMCPAADDWRAHWRKVIKRLYEDYGFDGLYFDFWYGKQACESFRHGCATRYRRATHPWTRDMLVYAYNLVKSNDRHQIIRTNNNFLPMAMITSLTDYRLVGEAINIDTADPMQIQGFYYSYRLGTTTELLSRGDVWSADRRLAFGLLIGSLPQTYRHQDLDPEGRALVDRYWKAFKDFPVDKARWYMGLSGQDFITSTDPNVVVNVWRKDDAAMIALVNLSNKPVKTAIKVTGAESAGVADDMTLNVTQLPDGTPFRGGAWTGRQIKSWPLSLGPNGYLLLHVSG